MVDAWGVDDGYWDIAGHWHDTPDETRRVLRAAMGGHHDVADPPPRSRPVWFVREGSDPAIERPATLVLEDGTRVDATGTLPPGLPLGYHDLHPNDGGPTTRLVVTPARCHIPDHLRTWGWAVQLYAARSSASWGIGDLGDLRRLAAWSAGSGAGILGVSPLHAALPPMHAEPSPYFPSSRRFRNPLYLRIEDVPGFDPADPVLAGAAVAGRALNGQRLIDRNAVAALKVDALERLWSGFAADPDFDRFCAGQGAPLRQYATFCALAEHYRAPWSEWAAEHRRPERPGVERFAALHANRVLYHAWLQWLVDAQLAAASTDIPLLGDLAVGVDPSGADAWAWQDVFARDVRVGAPPDEFNADGQDWGLPPFIPWKLRAAGYEPFAQTVRAALQHTGGLRVDHVMSLFRLYWIPPGGTARDGAYVRFPGRELLDIVTLESVRAGAFVVGEDLGTVEDEVREHLSGAGVLSYRLLWFEPRPPEHFPELALAAITTHDLPTVAGVWTGSDLDEQVRAGLHPNHASAAELRTHLADMARAGPGATVDETVAGAYQRLARAPSMLLAATLDDALGVEERPNLPGTVDERPNWCLALPSPLEEIEADPRVLGVAAALGTRDLTDG